jgi:hypothetical protein
MNIRSARVELTHDRLDFGHGAFELPGGALELIPDSGVQRGDAGLKALHFPQDFIDRIERFLQSVFRSHDATWISRIFERDRLELTDMSSATKVSKATRHCTLFTAKCAPMLHPHAGALL